MKARISELEEEVKSLGFSLSSTIRQLNEARRNLEEMTEQKHIVEKKYTDLYNVLSEEVQKLELEKADIIGKYILLANSKFDSKID